MNGTARYRKASLACLALLLLLLPGIAIAQSVTGTIDGFVTDAAGAAVPGAMVTATDEATKIAHTTTTNASGAFTLPFLNPGFYTVIAIKAGFTTSERDHLELQVNQTAGLTFALKIASVGQSVDVSTVPALLDIDSVALGTVISGEEATELPLNGRQFIQLLQLVPGVAPISVSQNGSQIPIGSGAINPAINGATNRSNLFFIDGVFATNPTYTIYAVSPPSDVVQEFQEQSHAMEAEFGQATGGTVSISTKAGTNHYHGNAYEFIRNSVLDAVPYFSHKGWYGDGTNPRYQQNQYGATIGGPFLKNKLFGFGNYEGYSLIHASTNPASLPTTAELGGDFSALLNSATPQVIDDPATYNPVTGAIQAFPGNIIPTARLNQPLIGVIKAFLPANLPTTPYELAPNNSNFTNTASSSTKQNQFGVRVDYAIGKSDLLYGDYFYELGTAVAPNGLPTNPFVSITGGKNTGLNYVHTFSPTLVAQLTMGWLRATSPGYATQPNAQSLFDSGGFAAGFTSHPGGVSMPFVPVIENDVFGINSGEGGDVDTVWQYSGSVTKQAGKHGLKFGASLYRATLNTNYAQDYEYTDQQPTGNPTTGGDGEEFASLFLGLPVYSGAQVGNSGGVLFETVLGFYAQDTWKVTPKFTLDYGLRWDYSAPVTDRGNRLSGFNQYTGQWYIPKGDVDAPAVLPNGVYVAGDHIAPNDYKNFSPRLGIA